MNTAEALAVADQVSAAFGQRLRYRPVGQALALLARQVRDLTAVLGEQPAPRPTPILGASLAYGHRDPLTDHVWPRELPSTGLPAGSHLYHGDCAWCRFAEIPAARDTVVTYLTGGHP